MEKKLIKSKNLKELTLEEMQSVRGGDGDDVYEINDAWSLDFPIQK